MNRFIKLNIKSIGEFMLNPQKINYVRFSTDDTDVPFAEISYGWGDKLRVYDQKAIAELRALLDVREAE